MPEPFSRKGAMWGAILFGGISVYFLWVAITEYPGFGLDPRYAYFGVLLWGLGALSMARTALHPETYKGPSVGWYISQAIEVAGYIVATLAAIVWLVKRLSGNATQADEVQRGGLWVLGILAVLVALRILGIVGPDRKQTKD